MIIVDRSVKIKTNNLKSIPAVFVILVIGFGLMILGQRLAGSDEITGFALAFGGIISLIAGSVILKCCIRKAQLKYLKSFFDELSTRGFNCDEVFDSGALLCYDPAVIVVDRLRREVGVMFYNNPESPYLIPAGLIKHIRSGKSGSGNTVSASFDFVVNGRHITVPTKVRRHKSGSSIESHSRQRYEKGRCGKAFNEAVEKADEFAAVLKKLTSVRYKFHPQGG